MVVKRSLLSAFAVLLAASAPGCSDPAEPEVVTDVVVVGPIRTVVIGGTVQFEGRAITNYNVRVDELITWTVSDPTVMSVSAQIVTVDGNLVNRATVTGVEAGVADLIATAGGKTGSVTVTVRTQ